MEVSLLTVLYYLAALLFASGVFAALHYTKGKTYIKKLNTKKLAALLYGALFLVRCLLGRMQIEYTVGLNVSSPFGPQGSVATFFSAIIIWLIFATQVLLVTYPFFEEHLPRVKPIIHYFAPVVYAIAIAAIPMLNQAMDRELPRSFHFRSLVFAIELGVGLGLTLFQLYGEPKIKQTLKQWLTTVGLFVGTLMVSLPAWLPQVIFGLGNEHVAIDDFTIYHRIALYLSFAIALPIHFFFTKCEYEQRRYALIIISMATMITFSFKYTFGTLSHMYNWPLHLCNTAMYIIPLVLIFKLDKVYYFTIFINVLGAFLAMIMPNTGDVGWLATRIFEFWTNHYMALLMPILLMSLRIFPRPKMKQFIYSLVAFFCYYAFVLVANSVLTGMGHEVDFFFINSDFIADKLGQWALDLRKITFTIRVKDIVCVLYPVYQIIFFSVYVVLSFAMWFLYEQVFEITDTYVIISERNRKIKADRLALEVHLAGRSMQEPMNPQNEGKLILRHFSKRYSTSDVYAVYDANLEIDGGQIFGFLGPNGAGKSTIIKSIVGIQTITSGEIEVSGYDVDKQAVGAKMQIGFVPDHYALYENLTGREYVNYIADLYNVSKEDRDARINDYVARFRLEGAIDNPMKTYSHGMKQKITIMSALVHNPKIWILDEPLTGLDPESIFQVKECMKEHASRGNIVFFSTHLIDVVENICDRIAIIRKGQILECKTVAEIKATGVPLEQFYMSTIDGNTQPPVSLKDATDKMKAVKGAAV